MRRYWILFFLLWALPAHAIEWKPLESGFEYRASDHGHVHFYRIDARKFRFQILMASDYHTSLLAADTYREKSGAVLVINGGFFDEFFKSLGLLLRDGKMINPLRRASWGVFSLGGRTGMEPSIVATRDWKPEGVQFAIQVGPRLVVDGKIHDFKEAGASRRSAIGITGDGLVEIALSDVPMTLHDWAEEMQKDCVQAMNLDGGGSSQFSIAHPAMSLNVVGMTGVPNAVAIFRR